MAIKIPVVKEIKPLAVFSVTHDRLRDGEFPVKALELLDIKAVKLNSERFKEKWEITIPDDGSGDNPLEAAYHLGAFIHSEIMARKLV